MAANAPLLAATTEGTQILTDEKSIALNKREQRFGFVFGFTQRANASFFLFF